jgi:hypothetical protein
MEPDIPSYAAPSELLMANWCTSRMQISGIAEALNGFMQEFMPGGILYLKKLVSDNEDYGDEGCFGCFAHFEIIHRADTEMEMLFQTRWAPPSDAFKRLATLCPALSIRVIAVEEGDEFAYEFTSSNARYKEAYPPFTEELVEEVTGEAQVIDPSYLRAATLQKPKATHFIYYLAKKRIEHALLDYPVCDPPHQGIEMAMSHGQARENFEYFMSERLQRLEYLNTFMSHFGVSLSYTEPAKQQLDRWFWKYGGLLHVEEKGASAFHTRNPKWMGNRAGFNIIFDLGTLLGEWVIRENPFLFWEMNTEVPTGARKSDPQFQKPVIGGLKAPARWRLYPIDNVFKTCRTLWQFSRLWRNRNIILPPKQQLRRHFTRELREMHFTSLGDLASAREESVWGPSQR